jgi:hypothetical protein
MLAATPAKEYANPKFLHAVLILWVVAVKIRCRFWCGHLKGLGDGGDPGSSVGKKKSAL